jgi:hypothetical protein
VLETPAAAEQGTGGEVGSEVAAAASASASAELAGEAAIWQQMMDEASGKPYWSLTRCVLPDERARVPSRFCRFFLVPLPRPPRTRLRLSCLQHVTGAVRTQQVQRKDRRVLLDPARGSAIGRGDCSH